MAEEILTGEEQGGEELGYRVPMALREEAEGEPEVESGTEETSPEEPGDAGEGVEVNEDNLLDLGEADLDAVIAQEGIEIGEGLSEDDKRLAIAEHLGYEIVEEEGELPPGESPEGGEEGVEELRSQVLELNRKLALLSPAEDLLEQLESDPTGTLQNLANYYGVQLGAPAAPATPAGGEFKIEVPQLEPGRDESMPSYISRVLTEGLKQMLPQLQAARPAEQPRPGPGTTRREDPHVKAAINYLTEFHPDWPKLQAKMTALLKVDPSLIKDPERLYKRAGGKGGPAARVKARNQKIVKKKAASGERGGRAPLKIASKRKLNPTKGSDMAEAWERAKRQASGIK